MIVSASISLLPCVCSMLCCRVDPCLVHPDRFRLLCDNATVRLQFASSVLWPTRRVVQYARGRWVCTGEQNEVKSTTVNSLQSGDSLRDEQTERNNYKGTKITNLKTRLKLRLETESPERERTLCVYLPPPLDRLCVSFCGCCCLLSVGAVGHSTQRQIRVTKTKPADNNPTHHAHTDTGEGRTGRGGQFTCVWRRRVCRVGWAGYRNRVSTLESVPPTKTAQEE